MTLDQYRKLLDGCVLTTNPRDLLLLDRLAKIATVHGSIYKTVERFTSIPWPLIAAIHMRESDQNFARHLHNGDPLSERTIHVPAGRPVDGTPPFTWIESATDALMDVWRPINWSLPSCIEFLERYNGLGYQKKGVNSPYVWNFTNQYTSGLFVADGHFDPNKTENRPGAFALVKALGMKGVSLDFSQIDGGDSGLH